MSTQSLSKTPYESLHLEYQKLRLEGLAMLKQVSEDTTDSRIAIRCWPKVLHQDTRQKLINEFNTRNAPDRIQKYHALEHDVNNLITKINIFIASYTPSQEEYVSEAHPDLCFLISLKEIVFDDEKTHDQGLLRSLAEEATCPSESLVSTAPLYTKKTVIVAPLSPPPKPLPKDESSYKITTTEIETHLALLLTAARTTRVATRTMMLYTNFITKLRDQKYIEQAKNDATELLRSYQFGIKNKELLGEYATLNWRLEDTISTFNNTDPVTDPVSAHYRTSAKPFLEDLHTLYLQTAHRIDVYTSKHRPCFNNALYELQKTIDPSTGGIFQEWANSASLLSSHLANAAKSLFQSSSTPPRSSSFSSSKSEKNTSNPQTSAPSTPPPKVDSHSLSSHSSNDRLSDESYPSSAQSSTNIASIKDHSLEDSTPRKADSPSQNELTSSSSNSSDMTSMEQQAPSLQQKSAPSVTTLEEQLDATHLSKEPSSSIKPPAEDAAELLSLIKGHQQKITDLLTPDMLTRLKTLLSTIREQATKLAPLPEKPKNTFKQRFIEHSIVVFENCMGSAKDNAKITSAVNEFKTQIEALIKE